MHQQKKNTRLDRTQCKYTCGRTCSLLERTPWVYFFWFRSRHTSVLPPFHPFLRALKRTQTGLTEHTFGGKLFTKHCHPSPPSSPFTPNPHPRPPRPRAVRARLSGKGASLCKALSVRFLPSPASSLLSSLPRLLPASRRHRRRLLLLLHPSRCVCHWLPSFFSQCLTRLASSAPAIHRPIPPILLPSLPRRRRYPRRRRPPRWPACPPTS